MPLGPGQEFWLEYNFGVSAWKLLDSIYGGLRNKWKNHLQGKKKKKTFKLCSKMSLGPTFQEFWLEYCKVTNCGPNSKEIGNRPNKLNTINL